MNPTTPRPRSIRGLTVSMVIVALFAIIAATTALTPAKPALAAPLRASTLTVGDLGGNELGYDGANGSLTDATFVYQHKPYTLQTIRWDSTNNTLQVTVAPTLEDQHRSELVLHVDDHLLGFEDANISSAGAYQWDVDLDWTAADQVRLRASSPIGGVMTVNTGTVTPGGGSPAYGYVKSADLTRPYNEGGSMSPKSFEYSRDDDHEIEAILRDTEHTPNRLIVFLSWELNQAKRNKTALRVDDEMYYFADSASAPEIDPGLIYHLPRKWDAPNLDWVDGETHQVTPSLLSYWGAAPAEVRITNPSAGPWSTFHRIGTPIDVRVTFSGPVNVDADNQPTIDLALDTGTKKMTYQGGSGTKQLNFRYTVQQGDEDESGVVIPANTLTGGITAASGSIILRHPEAPQDFGQMVDGVLPSVQSATVEHDELRLDFNEAMYPRVETGPSSFVVTSDGQEVGVTRTDVNSLYAVLSLAGKVGHTSHVTLTYTPEPGPNPVLEDWPGNNMPGFSNLTVTNNTPPPFEVWLPASAHTSSSHTGPGDLPQAVFDFSREAAPFTGSSPSLSVTNGTVSGIQRHEEPGMDNPWLAFIVPDGDDDVYFTLAPKPCDSGGICAPDGARLEKSPGIHVIAGPGRQDPPQQGDLIAVFEDAPAHHDGDSSFTFRVRFNYAVSTGLATLRDDAMDITNASPEHAVRVDGRSDLWQITVEPQGNRDVTIVLPPTEACGHMGAVCTGDGRVLSNRSELHIPRASNTEPTEPPPHPSNLTAHVDENRGVVLSWQAPDDDSVTGYRILRRRPSMGEQTLEILVADTGSIATTHTDQSATHGVKHAYRVRAINDAGVGPRSNYVNATP